jgi:5'-nucleotidase
MEGAAVKQSLALVAILALFIAGCSGKSTTSYPANETVTDVGNTSDSGYQQAQPVAPQPVVYDTMTTQSPGAQGSIPAGSYTVKKGDTLYNIAKQRYGDGKQWTRITDANPGLDPTKLRVGQTINIP